MFMWICDCDVLKAALLDTQASKKEDVRDSDPIDSCVVVWDCAIVGERQQHGLLG